MQTKARNYNVSTARRARTLAGSLAVLLAGATFYAQNVRAEGCGSQSDFLVRGDKLLAAVRPADCARLYQSAPDFTWPTAKGSEAYVVTVTGTDGQVRRATTTTNWLAWDAPLPAGDYTWTVRAVGPKAETSATRRFTVDDKAVAFDRGALAARASGAGRG